MEAKSKNPPALGRGLAALLNSTKVEDKSGFIPDLEINSISPNPKQPRAKIKPEDLIGLADSIRAHGIIEPLIVTKVSEGKYQLVAGERRWRAAKLAQYAHIPVIVREVSGKDLLELAIIENIQRKDLNPMEEAAALHELYTNYDTKLEELAKKVGKDVSTISNKMRLLKLPLSVQQGLLDTLITESHAYQLLILKSSDALIAAYNIIVRQHLSIRQTEELVRKISLANKEVIPLPNNKKSVIYDEKTLEIETLLSKRLGKGFKLIRKHNGGKLTIPFRSDLELEKLYKYILSGEFSAAT